MVNVSPHREYTLECENTWVPLVKKMGYDVIFTGSKNVKEKYVIEGDKFYTNTNDAFEFLLYKRVMHLIDWVLEENKYSHVFFVDNDAFLHPIRFHIEMINLFRTFKEIDYMGCAWPYQSFNPHVKFTKEVYQKEVWAAGSAMFFSTKSLEIFKKNYREEDYSTISKGADDWIMGDVLYNQGIKLLHNNSICHESNWKRVIYDPHGTGTPDITDKNSHLFLQHYCHNHMQEIMMKLNLVDY